MLSAQQKIDNTSELAIDGPAAEFRSLLQAIHSSNISNLTLAHPRGKILFAEGEPSRGVYILRSGRATVSISSSEGRMVILRIAQPGEVLGLNSVLRNAAYNTTVKTIESCRTDFIPRMDLVGLMQRSQPAVLAIAQILSREMAELTERARSLLLQQTAHAKLATLLLEWCEGDGNNNPGPMRIAKSFTQEEIAQMICSSRETVTRTLASLNRQGIIRVTADSILVYSRAALQRIAVVENLIQQRLVSQ
jgi:CRP/FNR family cyclic AMP-dependent transcriptional regulator